MPYGPGDFAGFGEVMVLGAPVTQLSDETKARQAASRAYYAGYHAVLSAVRARMGNPTYRVNHGELIQWMRTAKSARLRALGDQLENARALRSACDYDMQCDVKKRDAATQVGVIKRSFVQDHAQLTQLVTEEITPPPPSGSGF